MMMEETVGSHNRGSGISSLLGRDEDDDVGMLSTSLTGLEVLQRGLRRNSDEPEAESKMQNTRRQQQQGVSLLSRSLSESQQPAWGGPSTNNNNLQPSGFLPPAGDSNNHHTGFLIAPRASMIGSNNNNQGGAVAPLHPPGVPQFPPLLQLNRGGADAAAAEEDVSDHNPDTEGAFDLDFE